MSEASFSFAYKFEVLEILEEILYLIFDFPYKYYTFKHL